MADLLEEVYESTFDVGAHGELTLRNVRGDIDIAGWNQPTVHVVAVKKIGNEWGARESFEESTVEMHQSGARVRVRTQRGGGGGLLGWMGIGRTPPQVTFTIKVPETSDVSVRNVDGKIHIANVAGNVYARTVGGRIELGNVSGQIMTSVVDAPVTGSKLRGTMATKAVSGNVAISQSQLSSLWGKSVDGDMLAETTIDPSGSYEHGSVNGSLRLRVPPESRISAEMSSVSGKATCDLPHQSSEHGAGRRHWEAAVNGGGARVLLKTVSGDLSISATTKLSSGKAAEPQPTGAPAAPSLDWPEMSILKAVESGDLTVEDALARLAELDKTQ